jgi:hypothetical protein
MKINIYEVLLSRLSAEITQRTVDTLAEIPAIEFEKHIEQKFLPILEEKIKDNVPKIVEGLLSEVLTQRILSVIDELFVAKTFPNYLTRANLYLPSDIVAGSTPGEYLTASNPIARDFLNPQFKEFCEKYHHEPPLQIMHRKLWEFAFIFHRLNGAGVLRPGLRGLGFGVGTEKLPSVFANMGVEITATDALLDTEGTEGWRQTGQYGGSLEALYFSDIISRESFDRLVRYRGCDMNNMPEDLKNYDFCWSSCALEHLGSLQHGIDFIINSVEKTLKVGGIACHTTELNLSSDLDTLETSGCVLYRKQDLLRLSKLLEERGHWVEPLRIVPGDLPPDYLVDVPPYSSNPHLKLLLASYVTTSVGIVARRGR